MLLYYHIKFFQFRIFEIGQVNEIDSINFIIIFLCVFLSFCVVCFITNLVKTMIDDQFGNWYWFDWFVQSDKIYVCVPRRRSRLQEK